MLIFVALAAFAILRLAPAVLVLFGTIDLAGALWTAWVIRADRGARTGKLGVPAPRTA